MSPDKIVDTFWQQSRRAGHPTQSQLDTLTGTMNIPIMSLATSADGADFPVALFRAVRDRKTFEFSDDKTARPMIGFVAWGEYGDAEDLVAWSPRDGWAGCWLGRAGLLNRHELDELGEDDRLKVFMHVSDWLRGFRQGVVVLNEAKAAGLLEGLELEAVDVAEGVQLRKMMERPRARIVVPAREFEKAAA